MSGIHTSGGGAWKTCPQCGKLFFCTDCDKWAYKRSVSHKGAGKVRHFDKWSCLLAFDKAYEANKKKRKSEAAKEGHRNRKENTI